MQRIRTLALAAVLVFAPALASAQDVVGAPAERPEISSMAIAQIAALVAALLIAIRGFRAERAIKKEKDRKKSYKDTFE